MKLIGYQKSDFITKDGTEVKGYNLYFVEELNGKGVGYSAERVYMSEGKLAKNNIAIDEIMNRKVELSYNRFGKVERILVME